MYNRALKLKQMGAASFLFHHSIIYILPMKQQPTTIQKEQQDDGLSIGVKVEQAEQQR